MEDDSGQDKCQKVVVVGGGERRGREVHKTQEKAGKQGKIWETAARRKISKERYYHS